MLNYTALFDQGKGIQVTSLFWPCCASALSPASLADAAVSPGVAGLRAPSLNSSPFSLGGEGSRPVHALSGAAFLLSPVLGGAKENLLFCWRQVQNENMHHLFGLVAISQCLFPF